MKRALLSILKEWFAALGTWYFLARLSAWRQGESLLTYILALALFVLVPLLIYRAGRTLFLAWRLSRAGASA